MAESEGASPVGVPERSPFGDPVRVIDPPAPSRAMTIQAHPDDQEFTIGGTLAKWAAAGTHIVTVCLTSGGAGSNKYTPDGMTSANLMPIREREQRAACKVLVDIFPP